MLPEPSIVAVVLIAFLVSGIVKGVVGFGLPAVSLAILSIALDLQSAIALVVRQTFGSRAVVDMQGMF